MIATLLGSIGGLALGVTGGGGAIITIPLLVYGLSIPIHQAVLFSLFVVGFTALFGILPRWRWQYLEVKVALIVAIGGILAAPLGAQLSQHVEEQHLMLGFSLIMLLVGLLLWWRIPYEKRLASGHITTEARTQKALKSWHILFFCGAVTGLLIGFFGIGGGFFIVPSLVMLMLLPLRRAMTTSLLIIFLISLAGILGHLKSVTLDWWLLFSFLAGSVLGVWLGSFIANRLSPITLQRIFSVVVVCIGLFVMFINI